MTERIINAERIEQIINVFGSFDENIKRIEQTYGVRITNRGTELKVTGEEEAADRGARAIEGLLTLAAKGRDDRRAEGALSDRAGLERKRRSDRPDGQGRRLHHGQGQADQGQDPRSAALYEGHSEKHDYDRRRPAGTGKTYLAVAAAVAAFREKTVNRIILTRPAVEAGERLGFLPGDLQNKVDPYLRPLYDALL